MINSPSKFTSLERLMQIKKDNFIGETGKEYSEEEVNQMILEKKEKKAFEMLREYYSRTNGPQGEGTEAFDSELVMPDDFSFMNIKEFCCEAVPF